jgi:hypothetical protein
MNANKERISLAFDTFVQHLEDKGNVPPSDIAKSTYIRNVGEAVTRLDSHQRFITPYLTIMGDGGLLCGWKGHGKCLLYCILSNGSTRLQTATFRGHIIPYIVSQNITYDPGADEVADAIYWFFAEEQP